VEQEDFDKAKELKETIDKIKSLNTNYNMVANLEQQKKESINAEDYEAAKMIKMQIQNLVGQSLNTNIGNLAFRILEFLLF